MVGISKRNVIFWCGVLVAVSALHIYLLFTKKYVPPPDKVLRPTEFALPAEIGAALARRYWQELHSEKVVVLGLSPFVASGREIWASFLRTARASGVTFDHYLAVKGLPPLANDVAFAPLTWERLAEAVKKGERVLVFHVATDAAAEEISAHLKEGLVLLQATLALSPAGEEAIRPACDENRPTKAQLSCLARAVSRRYYRKKLPEEKLVAALEKEGPLKQILYVHEPATSAATPTEAP